jgi:hypothetical protein
MAKQQIIIPFFSTFFFLGSLYDYSFEYNKIKKDGEWIQWVNLISSEETERL